MAILQALENARNMASTAASPPSPAPATINFGNMTAPVPVLSGAITPNGSSLDSAGIAPAPMNLPPGLHNGVPFVAPAAAIQHVQNLNAAPPSSEDDGEDTPTMIQTPVNAPPPPVNNTIAPPTAVVTPLNAGAMNGPARMQDLINQTFAASPTDSVSDLTWKIRKKSEFNQKLIGLGDNFTAADADTMFGQWYQTVAPIAKPFQTFSPEEQQALQDAYGGEVPSAHASIGKDDVDKNMLAAAGGMLLAGLISGNTSQVWPAITQVFQDAKATSDSSQADDITNDNNKRQLAIQTFRRLTGIDDANAKQSAYEAHDSRVADREATNNALTAQRQATNAKTQFQQQMAGRYFDFLKAGDPARAQAVKDFYTAQTGMHLDDSFNELEPTTGQVQTSAQTNATIASTKGTEARTTGQNIANDLAQRTEQDKIDESHYKAQMSPLELQKLQTEVDRLPAWWDARTKAIGTNAAAAQVRAQAALDRASRVPAGKDPTRSRIGDLKTIVGTFNTSIDNGARDLAKSKADELNWTNENNQWRLLNGNQDNPTYIANLKAAQATTARISQSIAADTATLNQRNQELNSLVPPAPVAKGGK